MTAMEYKQLEQRRDSVESWTECGYCTFWCPIYQEDPEESSVARGKINTIRKLLAGEQAFDDDCAMRINRCLLCNTCLEHCPEKVSTASIIIAGRADKVRADGIKFPHNIVYRWLLPRRKLFGNVVRLISWFQGIFSPKTQGTIRHLAFFLSALGKGRHIPSIAPKFLRQMVPVINKPPKGIEPKISVGYFSGCMTEFVFSSVGKRTIDFLTKRGVEVILPEGQGCCGAPVYLGAGDLETGRKMADANVRVFEDVDFVVCGCATCTSAMKDYINFLPDTPERQEAYARFGEKLRDITEFLTDILNLPASTYKTVPEVAGRKITWHDPCHMSRYLGITEQPRHILKSIPDIEFVEMVRPDWCCGMSGAFSTYYYDLSKKIADKKMETIKESGADVVVTNCPGCQIQLIDNTIRHKLPVKVMHIMELLE
ncbi:(Fe-S)-binding protein [Chloroflexota bacterium]